MQDNEETAAERRPVGSRKGECYVRFFFVLRKMWSNCVSLGTPPSCSLLEPCGSMMLHITFMIFLGATPLLNNTAKTMRVERKKKTQNVLSYQPTVASFLFSRIFFLVRRFADCAFGFFFHSSDSGKSLPNAIHTSTRWALALLFFSISSFHKEIKSITKQTKGILIDCKGSLPRPSKREWDRIERRKKKNVLVWN